MLMRFSYPLSSQLATPDRVFFFDICARRGIFKPRSPSEDASILAKNWKNIFRDHVYELLQPLSSLKITNPSTTINPS